MAFDSSQQVLVERAKRRFAEIFPCAGKSWEECFMQLSDEMSFWFNDASGNTHMVRESEAHKCES